MSAARPKEPKAIATRPVEPSASPGVPAKGLLRDIAGSKSDTFNMFMINQAVATITGSGVDEESSSGAASSIAIAAMVSVKPGDAIEGMIAAQMFACHNATMEAFRRAGLPDQPYGIRIGLVNAASKCSRTFGTLLEGLNRSRGEGNYVAHAEDATAPPRATAEANGRHSPSPDEANADRSGDAP